MNTKAIYAACLFAGLNICTLSARAESAVKTDSYSHTSQLDARHVVSDVDGASSSCGVVNAHFSYQNSQGQTKVLDYLTLDEVCNQGG